MDQSTAWYGSADYADALVVRDSALRRTLIVVEGVDIADTDI
ncbi:MAG: hypothetical protein JWR37_2501 [Mycobacterium sp.]|nr:hypothetical protein [Mycobacterium sp.]